MGNDVDDGQRKKQNHDTNAADEDDDTLRASIAAMSAELKRRDDEYEKVHDGVKSCRELIAADEEWEALYQRLKDAEMRLAERNRKEGGCAHYIARRRRYCASRAGDGLGGFCSLHAPELGDNPSAPKQPHQNQQHADGRVGTADATDAGAIAAPAAASTADRTADESIIAGVPEEGSLRDGAQQQQQQTSSRKTNIHRRMKKMTNPSSLLSKLKNEKI